MDKIKAFLQGKKTYLTAAIGILGALVAWADSQIDLMALLASAWAAVMAIFVRSGVNNAAKTAAADAVIQAQIDAAKNPPPSNAGGAFPDVLGKEFEH